VEIATAELPAQDAGLETRILRKYKYNNMKI
jgi:hypothetical protein